MPFPWRPENIADWKANFGAKNLRTGEIAEALTIANPVVAAALESLTAVVNLSTGLGHPSDRAAAVRMFQLLNAGGEHFEPAEVRAWAANNGWNREGTRELEEVAAGVLAGRRFRVETYPWDRDDLERWRARASDN